MSIQEMELDPNAVDGAVFDTHIHNYDKMTGCDEAKCAPHQHTLTETGTPA